MGRVLLKTNPEVTDVFNQYSTLVSNKLHGLRRLILDTAEDITSIDSIEETLKWGEPSYLTKYGSTIRINHKRSNPEYYAMYFQCTSKLISTFKIIYKNDFTFEGNRALVFHIDEELPIPQLKQCIAVGLTYHKVKHLPLLGL